LRRLSLAAGFALIVLAFAAASRVTDTRAGLVAEIVTLLGGLAGIGLLTYAFAARLRNANRPSPQPSPLEGRGRKEYFRRKADDYDRWLRGMRRLRANLVSTQG